MVTSGTTQRAHLDIDAVGWEIIRDFRGMRGDGPGKQAMARRYMDVLPPERRPDAVMMLVIAHLEKLVRQDPARAQLIARQAPGNPTPVPAGEPPAAASGEPAPRSAEPVVRHKSETPGPAEIPALGKALAAAGPELLPAPPQSPASPASPAPRPVFSAAPEPATPAVPGAEVVVPPKRPVATSRFLDIRDHLRTWPGLASTVEAADGAKRRIAECRPADIRWRIAQVKEQSAGYAGLGERLFADATRLVEKSADAVAKSATLATVAERDERLLADMLAIGEDVRVADLPPEILDKHFARSVAA